MLDAGFYECQVTSHPPYSNIVLLKVVEAQVEISGPPEKFVKMGSSLELLCRILESPLVPEFIFWYHNERMVNYDKGHGMNITIDLPKKESYLVLTKATMDHTGNYTCAASNAHPDSVIVHVLEDQLAAIQTGDTFRFGASSVLLGFSLLLGWLRMNFQL